MRLDDFHVLVDRLATEVPAEFLEGIAEITVSSRTLPHPTRADIHTMGECIPLPVGAGAEAEAIQSRVVLYHGSFEALARLQEDFDWRAEVWETLTHELRHHLEWRARAADLEKFDEAAEQNFARQEGGSFDPLFYRDAEAVAEGVFRIDEDYFIEQLTPVIPESVEFVWCGGRYRARVPVGSTLPLFLTVEGLSEPPQGELVVVLRREMGLADLLRRPRLSRGTVMAERL